MTRPTSALPLVGLTLAFYSVAGCGGDLIHLGDGPVAVGGVGGRAGGSGNAGVFGAAGASATAGGGAGGRGGAATAGSGNDTAGESNDETGGAAGAAGAAGAETCPHENVPGGAIVWIGDSWITIPGSQFSLVEDRARMIGALGTNDDYVNLAAPALPMANIAKQYDMRESGATKVKVLIMDGGTWDPIAARLANGSVSVEDAANNAVAEFQQFLAKVASDGTVEDVVYFLVPPLPSIPEVDNMREPLQQACAQSTVPCYFIDLKDAWANHPEYTDASGIQASASGAPVIAGLIWQTMQNNCIAQ
ncbi:MAG TPA: hypothetical protein VMI54_24645 [Polyangiaceae bacterium]|nr:hypothetical protein [Polyangiaceae bacterium]